MPTTLRGRSSRWISLLFPLLCLAVSACRHQDGKAAPREVMLLTGMGAIHHTIATKNPEAQKFFDQGLALVYAFDFGEAVRSFQHAIDLDPDAAMPYWGLALAYGPNYNAWIVSRDHEQAGFDAIQTAVGLAPNSLEAQRAYIEALARCFTNQPGADQSKLAHDYSDAMREVYHRYPDDPDAAALFAASVMNLNPWHLWGIDGRPATGTAEIVGVLESALARWPEHTGVNHFYIHTMEGSGEPQRALASAQRLEALAPASSHLVHMPSHIYLRIGDYQAAVGSNQRAIAIDQEKQRRQPAPVAAAMGYANHNQHFLAVAAGMDGEFEIAVSAARQLQSHVHNEAMVAMSALVPLRFGRWEEVLRLPAPDVQLKGVTFFWHLARACAFASLHRLPEASLEQAAMEQAFSVLPEGRAFGTLFNDWSTLHALAGDTLAARIAAVRGDANAAIGHWRHAVVVQDGMNFDDVPDWYYPVRESLGAALLRNRQAVDAEKVFREDLKRNPNNPRSLFALSQALAAQGKASEAGLARQQFQAAWKGKEEPRIEDF